MKNLFYAHSVTGRVMNGGLAIDSRALLDFMLYTMGLAGCGAVALPRAVTHPHDKLDLPPNVQAMELPYPAVGMSRGELLLSLPRLVCTLFGPAFRKTYSQADHTVSIGLTSFGTLFGLLALICGKPHTFLIRGDRYTTMATSSRAGFNRRFGLARIRLYERILCFMIRRGRADAWFQGALMREKLLKKVPGRENRLVVLDAVLQTLPPLQKTTPKTTDIIFLGRIQQEKGVFDLLEALAILKDQGHPVTALFVGDGAQKQQLDERIQALGLHELVRTRGYVHDPAEVARHIASARLFVLASYTEGLPRAMLEAMALEVPVLVTPVGGIPEVITDGENGFLVDQRAPEKLAQRMRTVLTMPEPEIQRVRKHAKEKSLEHSFASKGPFFLANMS